MPNRVRFDGRSKRFYEVWYTIFNDRRGGDGFWIRYTLLNPLDSHPEAGAALWFGYTCRAEPSRSFTVKKGFAAGSFRAVRGEDFIVIGDARLEPGSFRGRFAEDGHEVEWDLRYEPSGEAHYFFDGWLRRLTESRNSVTVPNPRIVLEGTVRVDGQVLPIHGVGHQAHHWGSERARRWNWGHCCDFEGEDAVLELLSGEGPGGITPTFLNLYTRTERFLCNGLRGLLFNRGSSGLGFWRFEARKGARRIVADVSVDPRFVQRFVYVSPTYRSSECWNTQVGDCLVRIYDVAGSPRLLRALRAHGTAAAEIHDEEPERIPYRIWREGRE
jgi:hypothetical protein